MRALTIRAAASLLVTASLTLAAQANDLLVMPYACAMIGGRPTLAPAPEQGHRIIGQRERRNFTACSPVNPDMCRSWTVYRFELDCDGARVPWVSVVAAAAEQDRHGWLEDGRLRLRMGLRWNFAPDDPCAREPGYRDGLGFGRMRRYCADRRALTPTPVVDMPFGFAPMLGIDAVFVNAAGLSVGTAPSPPPVANVPAPPPKIARVEPPQAQRPVPAPPAPARPERPDFPIAKEVPARAPQPSPPQAAIQPAPQVAPPPPPVQVTRAPPPAAPAPQAAPPAPSSGPVMPKIINRPETATTDVAEKMPPETTAPNAEASKAAATPPPPPKEGGRQEPAPLPKADLEREDASIRVNLLGAVRGPALSAVAAFAGLALLLLAGFTLARRRDRLRHAGMGPRDFAWVPLGGRQKRGNLLLPGPAGANPQPPAPRGPMPPALATLGMPRTRAEALQVLGMGVTPDANEIAMKKIVDGLRLNWHPDLAKDERDRALRELRLKQINAAWELIQGKRVEA